MKNRLMKQIISFVLCTAMVLGYIPATVSAAEQSLCTHHQEHIGCSYAPAVEAADCTHECGDACYAAVENCIHVHENCGTEDNPCDHVCISENGCVTSQLNCTHTHGDCGYAEAVEEVPCDFVCTVCAEAASEAEGTQATDPVCYCVEKCVEANIWCDVCSYDVSACGGSEEAVAAPLNVEKDAPVIHSVSIDKTEVSAGDTLTVTMHVTDESELDLVYIRFYTPYDNVSKTVDVDMVKGSDDVYTGTIVVDDSFVAGIYKVSVVVAQDIYTNRTQYNSYASVFFTVIGNENDKVAPVIEDIQLDKETIYAGESVAVTMKVTDDSELSQVYIRFETPFAGVVKTLDVNLTKGEDGLYHGTVVTTDELPSGDYYAYVIVAEDVYGNRNQINSDTSVAFKIIETGVETNAPIIAGVSVKSTQVTAGDTVTITMNVSDESELSNVHVFVKTPRSGAGNDIIVYLNLDENGNYSGTLTTDSSFTNGTYYVDSCVAKDIHGNRAQIQAKSVSFELTGGYEDTTKPVIHSVTFDRTVVQAGETVTIIAEVTDESELVNVHVFVETPLAGVGNEFLVYLSPDENGRYTGTITTNSTFSNGTYYIESAVAKDIYGNRVQISASSVSFELTGGHSEVNAPVINSVVFDKSKVAFNETVTVTMDIMDESKMSNVHVFLKTPLSGSGNDMIIYLSLDEDGLYKGTFSLSEKYPYGTYSIDSCVAKDVHGNRAQIQAQNVSFNLVGSKIETNAPVINSVTVDKPQVRIGDTVTVTMDVTDESDLDLVYVRFDTPHAGIVKTIDVNLIKDEDGLYRGTAAIDDSLPYGFYYSYVIVAQDVLTNRKQINNDTSLYFEVVSDEALAYTVTWNIDDVFYAETQVMAGETITSPDYTVPEGYFFSGWDIPETMPAEDITLNAQLTMLKPETTPTADFTATGYDTGILSNVTEGMQYSLDQGETWVDITAETAELTGLEPLSHYYDKESRIWVKMPGNGTTTADSEIQKINVYRETAPSNVTAYGYYTITGVTSSMEYRKEGADQWTKVPQNTMSLTDLEVGVYEVRTAATGKYLASDAVDVTVEGIPVYTITYKLYGGTINGEYATEYTYGKGTQLPTDVTRTQFNFLGWSDSDKVFNQVIEIDTDASGDKTFYAWWEVAPYTVTWTINGEFYAKSNAPHMGHITAPDYLVPLGYTFSGWDIPDMMPAEDITLDATLAADTFKVTFTVNGEDYQQLNFLFGTAVTAPEYTAPEGYIFSGWDVPETMPAEDISLDATLTANKYKVTWIVDGVKTEVEYAYGATIEAQENPSKEGNRCVSYSFKMWEGFTEGMTMPAEDLEFTAVFDVTEKHIDWNRDHICDRKCGKTDIGEHADSATDRDHRCDYGCKAILEACSDKDGDRNHNCDICRKKNVTAHTYAEATCTKPATYTECGAKHGKLKDHDWDSGKVIKKPTCTKPGMMGFQCKDCHKPHIEMIKPVGHDWDNGKVIMKATCTKDGAKIYTCESCHMTRTEKVVAIGHNYHNGICKNCGNNKFFTPVFHGWWHPWWNPWWK